MAKKAKKDEASAKPKSKSKARAKQKAKDDKDKKAKKKPATPRAKKRKAAKATAESPLTTMAVTLGAALGRTERVARTAGEKALEAKKTLQQKFAALAKRWKRARSKTRRAATRKKQG
jgi:hypothetical protein